MVNCIERRTRKRGEVRNPESAQDDEDTTSENTSVFIERIKYEIKHHCVDTDQRSNRNVYIQSKILQLLQH